jgi:hypothetical protein
MTTKAQEKAQRIANAKRAAYVAKVRRLIGHVRGVTDATIIANYEQDVSAEATAADIASREPVGRAVHPLKVEAVRHAREAAQKAVDAARADLEANGWDINRAAPYPYGDSTFAGEAKRNKAHFYANITRDPAGSYYIGRGNQPHIVEMNPEGIARHIAKAEEYAAADYDAFIVKLVTKIGPDVTSASLSGSHVWGHSILAVMKRDGNETFGERWKTQQIVNYSKYGRPFYQWPSRKMK